MLTYATSVLLTKTQAGCTVTTHTLSVKQANSEDEAKGMAVAFALESKPGFSVSSVLCMATEAMPQPST